MGAAIAQRLLSLGHDVAVWNRTAEKTRPLAAAGAKVAATPAALAAASDTVITILTDAQAIDAAYHGRDGLLSGNVSDKLFIEMSTVRPETERSLATKISAKGAAMIECPVGGTIGPAKDGKLFGFVGGEAQDVARARPLLEQMCRSTSARSEPERA
jgi:3-hydroxyisobutyrate dehydrogenase